MNESERWLGELLCALEPQAFDPSNVRRACMGLAASLADLSREAPRADLERIQTLHGSLRALVVQRHAETERLLDSVVRARARVSCLTRPHDAHMVVDVDA